MMIAIMPSVSAEPMDTRTLAAVNKPAVVMLYTVWTADMTWYEFVANDSINDAIIADLTTMMKNGQVDENNFVSAYIQLYARYLPQYAFQTGNAKTDRVSTRAYGSGFIVTPDGYLVTNAHVVETNEEDLYYTFAVSNLKSVVTSAVQSEVEGMRREGYEMSQKDIDALYDAYFSLYAQSFEIKNLQTSYNCAMGNVTPGSEVGTKGVKLDLRKIGDSGGNAGSSVKDIAILKIDGANLPTVTLGDDNTLKTGDKVFAMGYPAITTVYKGFVDTAQAMQEPTLTDGIVAARKQMDGSDIIQHSAAIHGGNSGGPLFNEAGEVVGMNTWAYQDQRFGGTEGSSFAIPVSAIKVYLNELNVVPSESKFTSDFRASLDAYNAGKYNVALELLRGINETNPGFPVVQDLLRDAREAADANPVSADDAGISLVLIIIIAAAVLILGGVAVVVIIILNKNKKPAVAVAGAQQESVPVQNIPVRPAAAPVSEPAAEIHCVQCGAALKAGSKFCNECGTVVEQKKSGKCPACGHENDEKTKFCAECGTKLT